MIRITKQPYIYECGEGCCTEFGETWKLNDEEISRGPDEEQHLLALLKSLGIEAEVVLLDLDGGQPVCIQNTSEFHLPKIHRNHSSTDE